MLIYVNEQCVVYLYFTCTQKSLFIYLQMSARLFKLCHFLTSPGLLEIEIDILHFFIYPTESHINGEAKN